MNFTTKARSDLPRVPRVATGRRFPSATRWLLRQIMHVPRDVRLSFFDSENNKTCLARDVDLWRDDLDLLFEQVSLAVYVSFPERPQESVYFQFPDDYPLAPPTIVTHDDKPFAFRYYCPFVDFGHQIQQVRETLDKD